MNIAEVFSGAMAALIIILATALVVKLIKLMFYE